MVERLLLRTGGVPYFLVSCAQELRSGEYLSTAVPWNIGQSIRTRVAALDSVAQEVLRAAAVIGREVPHRLLAAMTAQEGIAERVLVLGLEASGRARLLVAAERPPHAPAYQFAHDLVRDCILADLVPARQLALHRAAATALEQLPEPERKRRVAELAGHLLAAGETQRALPFILQAGDDAETLYAHGDAERHYRAAVTIASELGDTRRLAEAQEKLGGVETLVTRFEDALEAYRGAARAYAALSDTLAERRMIARMAHTLESLGNMEQGKALLLPLLETIPSDEPLSTVAEMYWTLAWLCDDPLERLAACEHAAAIAREIGDHHMLAQAEFTRANTLLTDLGRIDEAQLSLENILPLLDASGDLRRLCSTLSLLADASVRGGRFAEAQSYVDRALVFAEQVGVPAQQAWICCNRGAVAYHAGDWQQAYLDFERGDAIYLGAGSLVDAAFPRWGMGLVLLARGHAEQAAGLLEEAIARAETIAGQDVETFCHAHAALAERDLVGGDARSACDRLERLLQRIQSRPGLVIPVLPLLAWAHLGLGDGDRAASLTQDAIARAKAGPDQLALVEALRVAAMVALQQQRWSDAQIALEEALALCRAMPDPYAEARALYVYGQLDAAQREQESARERFAVALAILDSLGERLYAERVAEAMMGLML
jgi:tetratricopeptide (TPR) repeat protein